MRFALPALALVVATGCASPPGSGTLVDALSGKPIAEMRIIANATGTASVSCSAFEATTDASGAFKFEGLCTGTAYELKPANENLWLAEEDTIPDGGVEGLELKAWRAPKGSGRYRLRDGELESIRTSADIKKEKIWKSDDDEVSYPGTIPKKPIDILPTDYLLLVGDGEVEKTAYYPLIASGERKFGDPKTSIITMEPWSYIGIEFKSDTEYEAKMVEVDTSKVIRKEKGDRKAMWIPGSALPQGRYAVHSPSETRTTVLDFGVAGE